MVIQRVFTKDKTHPYKEVNWVKSNVHLKKMDTGETIYKQDDVEVPDSWDALSTEILASKYFRRVIPKSPVGEVSLKQVVDRIVDSLTTYGQKVSKHFTRDTAKIYSEELKFLLINQFAAFNSPVWFNVGIFEKYGVESRGNHWRYSESTGKTVKVANVSEHPQSSACFIQSIDDSLPGIHELLTDEAMIFKYGSGTGTNMSSLRSKYEALSGGGHSSGVISFLEIFDKNAGSTKSGGVSRRAATMRIVDVDHPEVEDFISWKKNEEDKYRALVAAGFDGGINGEAYQTVSGQNSNNSVRVDDKFMRAVEADGDWDLIAVTTKEVLKTVKAKDLLRSVAEAAWDCGDPGVHYKNAINTWNTVLADGEIRASNPCSEFLFIDNSACNLASLNLLKFYKDGKFMMEEFRHACHVLTTYQDILVEYSSYPTKAIAKNSVLYRPLGLGYANLGGLFMQLGIAYDSDEARNLASAITALMTASGYERSAEIAEKVGPFQRYEDNKAHMKNVLSLHGEKTNELDFTAPISGAIAKRAFGIFEEIKEKPVRNAQSTLLAPTGTIGLLMSCITTGVEPDYALVKYKKRVDGSMDKIVNKAVTDVLFNAGHSEQEVREIIDDILNHKDITGRIDPKTANILRCASDTAGIKAIHYDGHIKMLAAVQPYLSGSISKTVNMPESATVEDIEEVYMKSWKMGLKSVIVFRDNSKGAQALYSTDQTKQNTELIKTVVEKSDNMLSEPILQELFMAFDDSTPDTDTLTNIIIRLCENSKNKGRVWGVARKLPDERLGRTWELKLDGTKIFLRSGEFNDGSLGEIFVDLGFKEGSTVRGLMNQFAISVSMSLQRGVPLETLVDKFVYTKFEPHGLVRGHKQIKSASSIIDVIFKVLGLHYLNKEQFSNVPVEVTQTQKIQITETSDPETIVLKGENPCSECGCTEFMVTGSCKTCRGCGTSAGGCG